MINDVHGDGQGTTATNDHTHGRYRAVSEQDTPVLSLPSKGGVDMSSGSGGGISAHMGRQRLGLGCYLQGALWWRLHPAQRRHPVPLE